MTPIVLFGTFAVLAAFATSPALSEEPIILKSGHAQVDLVERSTSQGCSSCPPAENRMSQLINDERLWKQILNA